MVDDALGWSLAALAVWRATHLLWAEDGPGGVFANLRRWAGDGPVGAALDCFNCLSLWVAMLPAIGLASGWWQGVIGWLALSGAAVLLQRATSGGAAVEVHEIAAIETAEALDASHASDASERKEPTP